MRSPLSSGHLAVLLQQAIAYSVAVPITPFQTKTRSHLHRPRQTLCNTVLFRNSANSPATQTGGRCHIKRAGEQCEPVQATWRNSEGEGSKHRTSLLASGQRRNNAGVDGMGTIHKAGLQRTPQIGNRGLSGGGRSNNTHMCKHTRHIHACVYTHRAGFPEASTASVIPKLVVCLDLTSLSPHTAPFTLVFPECSHPSLPPHRSSN